MKYIEKLIDNIYNSSKIPFQLSIDDYGVYTTPFFDNSQNCFEKNFRFEYTKCCIKVNAAFSSVLDLMIFCIKDKLQELLVHRKAILSSLLNGKEVTYEVINNLMPALSKEFYIANIYTENNIDGIFSYIQECYVDSDIEVIMHNGNILMIGPLEEPLEHMRSIKETIDNNFAGKYYISYMLVKNIDMLSRAYNDTLVKIELAKKYNHSESILNEKKLIIEGIIDSVSEKVKSDIYYRFNDGFSELDNQMIKTIDVFFKCGLNLSDAAKELYIHRNTLIYRLDKIQKCTSYDIREFNSAVLFKIVFFLWKEKKQKNS